MKVSAAAIWMWCCIMMVMVVMPSLAILYDECDQQLGYNTVSWDLSLPDPVKCYPKFLTRLRNQVEAPIRICGLPSTRRAPLEGQEYITVDLKISNRNWVTIGIDVIDLYVWGYQDKFNGILRSTFVNDVPQAARNTLFQDAAIRRTTNFAGNYDSLEPYARTDRTRLELGVDKLQGAIRSVYGKPEIELNNAAEAKFFLIVIQMVAEASRFKFMENAIVWKDNSDDTKLKMKAFQNDWAKISKAFYSASTYTRCTTINPPIEVGNVEYKQMVYNVNDIKEDIGLLKYVVVPTPRNSNMADNIDVGLAVLESAVM